MSDFIDCAAVALPFFAFVALVIGLGALALESVAVFAVALGLALELGAVGAVALVLALARRWWWESR